MRSQYSHKRKSWQELLKIHLEAMLTPLKIEERKYTALKLEKILTS